MQIHSLSLHELSQKLQTKELSSKEVTSAFLDRIKKYDQRLHAFLEVFEQEALEEASKIDTKRCRDLESLGALAGIPIGIKNNILIQGKKITAGSKMLESYIGAYDATVIEWLREEGMIFMGTTNMDEFAMGSSTENSFFGPTKNPWNISKVPGGTSGGSAASVAASMVPVALGSDTGGSIRQPASLCGVVGLKPTYGRVSRFGLMAMTSSFDQIGPLGKNVQDIAHLFSLIARADKRDATNAINQDIILDELIGKQEISDLRIGLPKEYFVEGMDEEIKQAVLEVANILEKQGATVKEISLPHTPYALAAYYIILFCEASSNLERFDGIRYGFSSQGKNLMEVYEQTRGQGFGAEVKRRIMLGTFALSKGYYDAYYRKALQVRTLIKNDFLESFKEVDVLLTPTSPSIAWDIGEKFNDPLTMYLSDIYTVSANLATIPALSLPCRFSKSGLPIGAQFMARPFDEYHLFQAGMFYQSITDWHKQTPSLV
ncbi:Asp-tRNA(Asn)/Glu-tRNA(Gln) amidotransferase GatCAB subunit A [Candidatus Uhrbacteria bacterium CG_4_9_14_3_um_filter_36_7]|uniref:Glutamyl-tRNA(Gln) amidotransferase subunit A n=1 Tax=Candidatus Uhrbacteria bacterium CG_4_9_14_3_um_filter_36_7 TaxID=1975033 RepID=A0A2M7XH39_9BACT|nr:MAG: Asp-tRNA(Asn)/Glu-tRNA(Gln) amidotransferase GatCAB subunit A [Candidatus Uhrbacteria bacterium CG_4_9_14_3_um_filter_36_7]